MYFCVQGVAGHKYYEYSQRVLISLSLVFSRPTAYHSDPPSVSALGGLDIGEFGLAVDWTGLRHIGRAS